MLHFVHCLKVCILRGVSEHGSTSVFKSLLSLRLQNIHLIMLLLAKLVKFPIPMAAQFKAWVYGRSFAMTAGSNPAVVMDVSLL